MFRSVPLCSTQSGKLNRKLERLAVLPEKRNQGLGKALVEHVLSKARELGVDGINIGIIADD